MKKSFVKAAIALLLALSTLEAGARKQPVDYVNPYIGNISHLLVPTFATIQLPCSMLRVYPTRGDYTGEYLDGLPVIVTNHRERSAFCISVTQGKDLRPVISQNWDNEHITPYGFDVELADNSIAVRYAVSHQSAIYEFEFQDPSQPATIIVNSSNGAMHATAEGACGHQRISRNMNAYLSVEFDVKPEHCGKISNGKINVGTMTPTSEAKGQDACLAFQFPADTRRVCLRYGVSFIDEAQAQRNLQREQQGFDLKHVAAQGRKIWNEALSKINVEGGTEDEKTVLYTSFYRTMERPVCLSEDGRYFSGYDGKVHEDGGKAFYADDWIWDTYRAAHPLRALLRPTEEEHIIESYLRQAEQNGSKWMPTFPELIGDTRRMNSNHGVAMVADALYKGLDVDAERAYEYCRRAIEEKTLAPWMGKPAGWIDAFYKQHGYIPALAENETEHDPNVHGFEKRQPIAVTLGTAYDEWCLSRIAHFLHRDAEAAHYNKLGYNYRTVFNPDTQFFHPKDSAGNFLPNFDYRFSGGVGAREAYDENNGWTYRWDVQHNVADLIRMMGGREQFVRNLNQTFAEPMGRGKREFYEQLPDQTGNIGQFSMANEPSLHIPYLYNYAGAPWLTQKRVRQVLRTWFRNDVMGIPGDEDGGGLTSFVVFSSIGLYPVTPGFPIYNITSPTFSRVTLQLPNGKTFVIKADGASEENKYIQSATLNGKDWNRPWLSHSDLAAGGTLVLKLGAHPNKQWGAAIGSEPPSAE